MGDHSWSKTAKFMSLETAKLLGERINEHMEEFNLDEFFIGFHGGEPLLMKPNALDSLVTELKFPIKENKSISLMLQSNGVLISTDHIEIFKKHNIGVSISLDGSKKTNDKYRLDHKGLSSWQKVINGIELISEKAPELFNGLLSVIDIESDPIETFDYLAQFGVDLDFLLPLHNHEIPPPYPDNSTAAYGKWYYEIYKEWINGRHKHLEVRFIKNIITQLIGGEAVYEVMNSNPIGLLTINTDGFIEGLDCLKSSGSGIQITNLHIKENSFTDSLDYEIVKIRQSGVDQLHEKCRTCDYIKGCAGGYLPARYSKERKFDNPSVYCEDLYWLLSKIESDLIVRCKTE
jgi:uncharacterized protein